MRKLPLAGEWWRDAEDEILFVVGHSPSGDVVCIDAEDSTWVFEESPSWDHWHHLPDCTGFDWKPEPEQPSEPRYQSDVTCSIAASERERKQPSVKRVPLKPWVLRRYIDGKGAAAIWCQQKPNDGQDWIEVFSDGNEGWEVRVTE